MDILDVILLGIIQGLTEFLPVSSSGHLELGKAVLGANALPRESLLFTIVLHAATALSTCIVFRKDLQRIFKGLFQFKWNEESRFSLKIVVSMIPATAIGLLFEEQLTILFGENIQLVGCMLLITALLLYLASKARQTHKTVTYANAFVVGVAQAIAILPGISRSGATISTSVLLGIDKAEAARFSFLMVVPLILGSIAKTLLFSEVIFEGHSLYLLALGFATAFLSGWVACRWMIAWVKRSNLLYFSFYCFLIGAVAIGYSWYVN